MKQFNLEEIMKNGGRCQTRDGRPARIICTDFKGTQIVCPDLDLIQLIIAVVTKPQGEGEQVHHFGTDGHFYADRIQCEHDLVPLPKRIQREYWANGYATGQFGFYSSREGADLNAGARIACVRVVIDCEEGEGL